MIEHAIQLDEFNFDSCISSDLSNQQKVVISKSDEVLAEFILKPISYGDLMSAVSLDKKSYEAKALSSMIVNYKIKTADGFKEGGSMTEEEIGQLLPNVMGALSPIAAKLIYVTKPEEKNSATQFSG